MPMIVSTPFIRLGHGIFLALALSTSNPAAGSTSDYAPLVDLFGEFVEWRTKVSRSNLALDPERYDKAAVTARVARLREMRRRFDALETSGWSVPRRVDYLAVRAQLDREQFRLRVSRPWARDPGFYVDPLLRIAFTDLPVDAQAEARLGAQLDAVTDWLALARDNLDEGAAAYAELALRNLTRHDGVGHGHPYRETPPAGVIGWYRDLLERARTDQPSLVGPIEEALAAIRAFEAWLGDARSDMTAEAGVGARAFDWYLRNVKLMPYSGDEVIALAARELERLRAFYALERVGNRHLPEIRLPQNGRQYRQRVARTDAAIREFITETEFITVPDYIPDDFEEMGFNVPWIQRDGGPNYWEQIQYRDPSPDHWHAVIPGHRFDGMVAARDEHPIRRHIADAGRVEGWATYLEEVPLQLGFYDDKPRVRELIYNFGIFRAVRTIGDVKLQRNQTNPERVAGFWMDHTPWLDDDVARVDAEIYLRRPPGYGISYTIGAFQIQQLLADRQRQLGEEFELGDFHDRIMDAGRIPISLLRWEMTGLDDEIERLWTREPLEGSIESIR